MTLNETVGYGEKVLRSLKNFQRKTAEYVFDRLYTAGDSTRRFLIADEVGLGKTLVAAGVTAQAIDHLSSLKIPRIDIIYICSNQAIARQNIDRIKNLLSIKAKPLAERITLLPYRLNNLDQPVNLVALTPGTSFNTASPEGIVEERVILFRMLTDAWGCLGHGARHVFLGRLSSVKRFREYEAGFRSRQIDDGIVARFRCAVGNPGSELHREFVRVRDFVASCQDWEARQMRRKFIAKLRGLLAQACLDALEPDLVILDEFQRFRALLDPRTETGELARHLLEYEDDHTKVRTLLLSATPYKMYTLSHEAGEDHYRDFLKTVHFLMGREGSVEPLEESLRKFGLAFPHAVRDDPAGNDALCRLSQQRNRIQSDLLRVMTRTERRGRGAGGDPMLKYESMSVDLRVNDVEAFLGARQVAALVDAPGVMEYWKSSPYLLSFMDRYKLSNRIRNEVEADPVGKVAQFIRGDQKLQLPRRSIDRRNPVDGGNGRMRWLLDDLRDSRLHGLLWLPPSLPEHTLGRDFERARSATKRLIFSSWIMVPRAVAAIASYDAERRHVPDPNRARRYVAQLLGVTSTSYSLFALLLPSATLAAVGDPFQHPQGDASSLLDAIRKRLRPEVVRLTSNAPAEGSPREIWYAVLPLLLDGQSPDSMEKWLQHPPAVVDMSDGLEDGESTAWQALVTHVRNGLANPAALGRPPGDLLEVMAALAAGSPANAALRALSRITSTLPTDNALKGEAMKAAHGFRSLFRAPTSEGLLRHVYKPTVPTGSEEYWRRVLAYGLEGGLTGVLTEFFHVTRESLGGAGDVSHLVGTLCRVLRMGAGRLEVSQWRTVRNEVQRETLSMRQHFARRYASEGAGQTDLQSSKHLDVVRSGFNSPFWPFVLATTSIGQEGLDFHWYCHSVVHWNLPSNPVDLEQREGRVHRYHGHVIRKNIAQAVGQRAIYEARVASTRAEPVNPWDAAFAIADDELAGDDELVPHWVFTEGDARIQRHCPVLPLSRDVDRVEALRRSLAVYRMVFGQPRQDDLLEFILRNVPDERQDDLVKALTIDLRPPDPCSNFSGRSLSRHSRLPQLQQI